jgi:hypothetical protein
MIEVPEVKGSSSREMKLEACQIIDLHQNMTEGRKAILNITSQQTEKLFINTGSSPNLHNTLNKLNEDFTPSNQE